MYDVDKHKSEVRAEVSRRGLGSLMNSTKWRELQREIAQLPFSPPFQRKDVLCAEPEPVSFETDGRHLGDWTEGILPFFSIEWLRVRPRFMRHVATLLPPTVVDCEPKFENALRRVGIPYEKREESIWIYGYK